MADKRTQSGADWPRTILLASGIFAVGAIGFFLAVVLQNETAKNSSGAQQQQLSVQQKSEILNTLNTPASTSSSGTTSGASSTAGEVIQPSQADQNDSNAAAKLNALNALNAQ